MARDDPSTSSTVSGHAASSIMRSKVGSEFESYNAPMHFRYRQTDGLASWHKHEMYILHLALIKLSVQYEGKEDYQIPFYIIHNSCA